MKLSPNWAAKIGAASYVLWGVYHFPAVNAVYRLANETNGTVRGRLLQCAFYMFFLAITGIVIAARLNWRNDRRGYWINGVLVALSDLPFVLFVLVPGLYPVWPGVVGPLLWLVGLAGTTIGQFQARPYLPSRAGD